VLATARDIIFLWVARMIFSGLELIGEEPFSDAVIHSYLQNPEGKRMSRTLGTGIDPEEALEPYGADATRYGLLKMTTGQDPRFSWGTIEEGRKLANKLWNASRLLLLAGAVEPAARPSSVEERWILARIEATRAEFEADLAAFDFAHAVQRLYHLTFDDFCDWYLESIKPRLAEEDVRATAFAALERLLKLLHPVMPHVTEEIWTNLPARETRLIVAPWPEPEAWAGELDAMESAQTAARIYRRSGVRIKLDGDSARVFESVVRPTDGGGGDLEAERTRVQKEIERAERMLSNEKFVANAAPEAVAAEREKLAQYVAERDALG
jgi:valyl-tRNA synthetase